jgi:hypothetical protein
MLTSCAPFTPACQEPSVLITFPLLSWFSSNWDGAKIIDQPIADGNVLVQ